MLLRNVQFVDILPNILHIVHKVKILGRSTGPREQKEIKRTTLYLSNNKKNYEKELLLQKSNELVLANRNAKYFCK